MADQPSSPRARPPFVDFVAPFCAGWLAHRENPEIAQDDGEAIMRLMKDAYERSGPMLAYKVAIGEISEAEAREALRR